MCRIRCVFACLMCQASNSCFVVVVVVVVVVAFLVRKASNLPILASLGASGFEFFNWTSNLLVIHL
jgi:hypothetical protein